ncbi:hypothetical protein I6N96_01145 [Enterococcus sp. BWM-S5]|uniref:Uncharacterized protein n=1 Tax=Enterococcus larvae TaxID=2794352 RepID=A0ABS4CEE5_9ENTE|nr:hypothetical protein [Enterococcus larvae]MBP1044867.1 hypothetical protein [Enterococcus larvae]
MAKFQKRSKKLNVGKFMPPSFHKLPDKDFDITKSETVQWLIQQPDILAYVWDQFKQSGDVEFNPKTGKWKGIFYGDEDNEGHYTHGGTWVRDIPDDERWGNELD